MGRHKTISDEDVLGIAREAFRRRGFAMTGREIAKLARVSEAVLYQRFESKDALFFAAMAPTEPDIMQIFGPRGREGDAHAWIRRVVDRMSVYFEELIPLAIQVLMHPDYKKTTTGETGPASQRLEKELSSRLRALKQRGAIASSSHQVVARLLIGIAHDWALHHTLLSCCPTRDRRPLAACVDVAWRGIAPDRPS